MNSSFCLWFADVEEALWRMIRGVFRFTFHRLPEGIYRALVDTVGPATIRLVRVLVVFCLWLAVVFGPVLVAVTFRLPLWVCAGTAAWLVLAIIGSSWGHSCLARKRRAAAAGEAAEGDRRSLDGPSARRERVVR